MKLLLGPHRYRRQIHCYAAGIENDLLPIAVNALSLYSIQNTISVQSVDS